MPDPLHTAPDTPLGSTAPQLARPWDEPNFGPPQHAGEVGTLGRYRVLQKLGQGGMGAVYLGFHDALARKVALKVMLPAHAANPDSRERFLREARAAAMVKSDHVVTIHDVDEAGGVPFIAMEYLLGSPLDQFLKTKGELPLEQVLRVGRETALGLAAAHDLGLIHRDIKPGNVWLEAPKGRVKILDFGLARAATDDAHLTGSGAVVGTPAFMSPEQARGRKVDRRTDLFSLGVMLYRLCTGKMPFTGDGAMAVLTSLAVDTPAAPRSLNPQLPAAVEAIVAKLLAKNPDERFQTAHEVADALAAAAAGPLPAVVAVPVPLAVGAQTQNVWEDIDDSHSVAVPLADAAATEGDAPRSARPKPVRPPSKLPLLSACAAVLLAAVAVAAVVMWPKKKPPQLPPADTAGVTPPPSGPYAPKLKDELPADLIPQMTPVKPKEVFALDHLNAANPKHVPPEEKFAGQPGELVAVLGSRHQRTPGSVNALEVSPDGMTVLAGWYSPGFAYDVKTGRPLDWPAVAAFSPDGKRAAGVNEVWEIADLKRPPVKYPIQGHISAFLTNDTVLVASADGYVAWKLDLKQPEPLKNFGRAGEFAVSNDRKYLAVVSADATCQVFAINNGRLDDRFVLPGEEGKIRINYGKQHVTLSDAGTLATVDPAGTVRVWDVTGAKPQLRHSIDAKCANACMFPKGDYLICQASGDQFQVWSLGGDTPRKRADSPELRLRESNIGAMAVTLDGQTIITGHLNGAVRFWGVANGVIFERNPISASPMLSARYADIAPDGRFAALYSEDFRTHIWDLAALNSRPLDWTSESYVRFAPDGATAAVWGYAGTSTGNCSRLISSAEHLGTAPVDFATGFQPVCYSPDGKWVATTDFKELAIWDVSVTPPKERFARVPTATADLWQFTPDGRFLVAVSTDSHRPGVWVWAVTARGLTLRQELTTPCEHFVLSRDGRTAVFCDQHKGLKVYDLKDGLFTFRCEYKLGALWADFSPDGRTLLIGGGGGLKLLDASTGKAIHEWTLRGAAFGGRFHPDGRHVFVTTAERTTYVLRLPK